MESDRCFERGDGKGGSFQEGAGQPRSSPTLYRISTKTPASEEDGGARQCVTGMELWQIIARESLPLSSVFQNVPMNSERITMFP